MTGDYFLWGGIILYQVQAMVHSKKDTDTVTILEYTDNNHVLAEYNGTKCTAIFNPFVGLFYVDDVYGILNNQ